MDELIMQKKEYLTLQAKSCLKRMTSDIIELSRIAHDYHQEFGYQEYIAWIGELGLSETQGDRFLNVYEKFGVTPIMGVNDIKPTVLYLLSAPSTPESARTEAIEITESGETLSIKEAKRIIEEHKAKIEELESKPAQTQIVFKEILPSDYQELKDNISKLSMDRMELRAKISQMKANHEYEIKKIANSGETIPADYAEISRAKESLTRDKQALIDRIEQINAENEKLSGKINKLKSEQDSTIAQAVTLRMRELQDEFETKEKQLASIQGRIELLNPEMNKLERKVGDLSACRESAKEIRQHLMGISIVLGDLFSDIEIPPDTAGKELMVLANEMHQGAIAFKNFLTGTRQIGEVNV